MWGERKGGKGRGQRGGEGSDRSDRRGKKGEKRHRGEKYPWLTSTSNLVRESK